MLSGNSLRQTVHTHCASVHQAAKLVAALLRVVGVTAGLAESYVNGSLLPGLWLTSPACWLPRAGISSGSLRSLIEYGLPLPFYFNIVSWRDQTGYPLKRYPLSEGWLYLYLPCVWFAGAQDSSYNDHLKSLHIELRKKHKAGELDGYCLYVYASLLITC